MRLPTFTVQISGNQTVKGLFLLFFYIKFPNRFHLIVNAQKSSLIKWLGNGNLGRVHLNSPLVPYKDVSFYWCFTTNHFCKLESQVFPLIFFFLSKILLFDGSNVAWMVDSVPIKRLIDLILRQKLWKRRDDLVRLKMSAKKKSAMSIWSHFRSASFCSVFSPFFLSFS